MWLRTVWPASFGCTLPGVLNPMQPIVKALNYKLSMHFQELTYHSRNRCSDRARFMER